VEERLCELPGQDRLVDIRDEASQRVGYCVGGDVDVLLRPPLKDRLQLLLSGESRAELLDVLRSHASQEVEALGVVGRAACHGGRGDEPVWHQGRAGQSGRATSRTPERAAPFAP